ncbi:MAG: ribonuclease [Bacteroidetes bacterium]|nr:MAG: ribonuclease [Bacteroidota bacterium]
MAKKAKEDQRKIFVLDTSVILYDHRAVVSFDEHDVVIPIEVLEEVDNFKKGNDTVNFEARSFIRFVDKLSNNKLISRWISLGKDLGRFKVALFSKVVELDAVELMGNAKYDHRILNCALSIKEENPEAKVTLISQDICLRLKAKALNLKAADFQTTSVQDVDTLFTGKREIIDVAPSTIDRIYAKGKIGLRLSKVKEPIANEYYLLKSGKQSALSRYNSETGYVEQVLEKRIFNINALNAEQSYAINALLNPDIKLVSLQGKAGTGKTLLALAAALEQRSNYRQIFVTRPVIPLTNQDIGFLPGDIESKMDPFMQSIWDNLKFIKSLMGRHDKDRERIDEMIESEKITVSPLAYIRGRSLQRIFFIVDEAQNLTPHEIKTIISRAGDQTKIVFMGDINQIDTPYMDARTNGLSYLIDRVKGHKLFAHVTLEKGERSELANVANDYL